jgi:Ca2+-binding RTX toxin-like protein
MGGRRLLDGGEGDDTLNGGAGADTMVGGNGNDIYYVDNIGDTVLESGPNGGFDVVNTAITLTMPTNVEAMYLIGSAPINGFGNDADNQIIGNSNSNTLTGGFGNDYLFGEGGADTMIGGIGNDTYNVGNVDDMIIELNGEGRDTVFSNASAYTLSANVEVLQVYATGVSGTGNENAFFGVAQLRFNGGFVEGDIDGDLNADFRIQVNAPSLVATDFIL